MVVLDASAILAYIRNEPGRPVVKKALGEGAICSAANWSEVMQKEIQLGGEWNIAQNLLSGYDITIEPVTRADAEWAAYYWIDHPSLSLADRLCLALANRLGVEVLTADSAWGANEPIRQIR